MKGESKMKKTSRLLSMLLAGALTVALAACGGGNANTSSPSPSASAPAESISGGEKTRTPPASPTVIRIACGPVSGTQNTYYSTLADYITKDMPGFYNFMIEASTGSAENMRLLAAGEVDFGTSGLDQTMYANEGTNGYEGLPTDQIRQVYVFAGQGAVVHVVAAPDSTIETIEDLKGKKVAATAGVMQGYLEDVLWAHDMSLDDLGSFTNLSLADMITALQDGTIDALCYGNKFPNVNFTDLATTFGMKMIDIGEDAVNKLVTEKPWYHMEIIPGGTYKGCDNDVYSFCQYTTFQANKNVPDEVVYDILAANFAHAEDMSALHPDYAKYNDINEITRGNMVPYHPGAAKFYAEHGLTVPTE